ncbi:hypothetical protein [Sphingomonas sp.]|uniref:hypothetical protein n=1 Tax=Sphingomonas sp. TaxID=28214 RepID=UPI003B3BDE0A
MADHVIFIRPEPFGVGFDITVEPGRAWSNCNTERPTLREAPRYADSPKNVHGWPIRDETGEAA